MKKITCLVDSANDINRKLVAFEELFNRKPKEIRISGKWLVGDIVRDEVAQDEFNQEIKAERFEYPHMLLKCNEGEEDEFLDKYWLEWDADNTNKTATIYLYL